MKPKFYDSYSNAIISAKFYFFSNYSNMTLNQVSRVEADQKKQLRYIHIPSTGKGSNNI